MDAICSTWGFSVSIHSEEVLVRDGDLAVRMPALLLVADLILDLERARARLDHLLGEQVGRLRVAEPGVDVGDDGNDVAFVALDLRHQLGGLGVVAGVARRVDRAE